MEGVASVYFVVSDNDFGPRPKFVQFEASETLTLSVDCLFLRSPSRVPYRTELIPRAPKLGRERI